MVCNTYIKNEGHYVSILNAVIGQMSDGIWENTPSMEKYWKSLDWGIDADNNIIIKDKHNVCSDPVDFFANKIKQIVKIDNDYNGKLDWSRTNSALTNYISYGEKITVGECYKLYDLLKGRDVTNKRYSMYENYNVEVSILSNVFNIDVEALSKYSAESEARKKISEMAKIIVR